MHRMAQEIELKFQIPAARLVGLRRAVATGSATRSTGNASASAAAAAPSSPGSRGRALNGRALMSAVLGLSGMARSAAQAGSVVRSAAGNRVSVLAWRQRGFWRGK